MKNRYEAIATALVLMLAGANTPAQEPAPAAAVTPLTWSELFARPELWPRQCRVQEGLRFETHTTVADTAYEIILIEADRVGILLPDGKGGSLAPDETDLLEAANAAYARMTPEHRALDLAAIARRADLWPDTVKLMTDIEMTRGDEEIRFERGTEVALGSFDGAQVRTRHPERGSLPYLRPFDTDFLDRVREAFVAGKPSAGHRVLRELHGKLMRVPTGKKTRVDPKRPPDYVVLYFSADWCGPCHEFSPSLVRFYEQNKKLAGKRFEVIWISRDRSEREMQGYGKQLDFPWLAVRWRDLGEIPVTQAHDVGGIPDLVLLDRNGAVVADSYAGTVYKGADSVLEVLAERIASGK